MESDLERFHDEREFTILKREVWKNILAEESFLQLPLEQKLYHLLA